MSCGLQPSTTSERAGQANTSVTRGKVRSICGAKVGATDGNDGKKTKDRVDHDGRNLISGGSAVGSRYQEDTIFMHLNCNKTNV